MARPLDKSAVKGKAKGIVVYELMARAQTLAETGVPEDWDGVKVLTEK